MESIIAGSNSSELFICKNKKKIQIKFENISKSFSVETGLITE
jgi:hypothetical protein